MVNKTHIFHLLYLVIGLGVCFGFFVFFRFHPMYQFYASICGVFYYILWGFFHHYIEDRLSLEIIMEYVLIGGVVVMLFALVLGV